MGNFKLGSVFRILAGGYLIYISISMIQRFREQSEIPEEALPGWALIPAFVFMGVGIFLIITFLRKLTQDQKKQWEELKRQREEAEAKAAESETYSATPLSMTQITQYNSSTDDSEDEDIEFEDSQS